MTPRRRAERAERGACEDHLTAVERAERGSYVACIAGALTITEYRNGLFAAGFTDITVAPTHQVAAGMLSAIVKASKPATTGAPTEP